MAKLFYNSSKWKITLLSWRRKENSVETLRPILIFSQREDQVDLIRDECCLIFNSMIVLLSFMPGEVISTLLKFN